MDILITNDDGIHAQGLWALHRHLSRRYNTWIVAPDRERSAVGHAITLNEPLRAVPVSMNGCNQAYAVNGTPADCVKLAVLELMQPGPQMVVSGINPGANIGVNLNYSGTVAAAREATLYGVPALAVSIQGLDTGAFDAVAEVVLRLAEKTAQEGLPPGTFLNVNFPDPEPHNWSGIKVSRQGAIQFHKAFEKRTDPRKRSYYWQASQHLNPASGDLGEDGKALCQNYITITPVKCDTTDYPLLEAMKTWGLADAMNPPDDNLTGSPRQSGKRHGKMR